MSESGGGRGDRASILIMARAPRPGQVRQALEPVLGEARCAALQTELISQTTRWAEDVAHGPVFVAYEPPDAASELRQLIGNGTLFPQNGDGVAGRLADGIARVFKHARGPLLIVWPDLPRLPLEHGDAALGDLEAGCDLVLGPAIDGGFYLIAINQPLPELFALSEAIWRSPDVMGLALAAAREAGLEVGILRPERALHRPADIRAALADPLLGPRLRAIIA
jgi:glycosyltransferase A (GT-A) superfamily protein (DUF2064 family)